MIKTGREGKEPLRYEGNDARLRGDISANPP